MTSGICFKIQWRRREGERNGWRVAAAMAKLVESVDGFTRPFILFSLSALNIFHDVVKRWFL